VPSTSIIDTYSKWHYFVSATTDRKHPVTSKTWRYHHTLTAAANLRTQVSTVEVKL